MLPGAAGQVRALVARFDRGRAWFAGGAEPEPGTLLSVATGLLGTVFGALSDLLLVVVMALFLAAGPAPCRRGVPRLVPPAKRGCAAEILDALGGGPWRRTSGNPSRRSG